MTEKFADEIYDDMETAREEETGTIERFLTFESDGLIFGVSTDNVIEILSSYNITPLPMVPSFVQGIINVRGQIIPILDIRMRMGKPAIEYTSQTCVVVLDIDTVPLGIIVDSVAQVMDIDCDRVSPVPANNQQELVNGMISLSDKNVVLLLDCPQLLQ